VGLGVVQVRGVHVTEQLQHATTRLSEALLTIMHSEDFVLRLCIMVGQVSRPWSAQL
jgi:hypothetical protein